MFVDIGETDTKVFYSEGDTDMEDLIVAPRSTGPMTARRPHPNVDLGCPAYPTTSGTHW